MKSAMKNGAICLAMGAFLSAISATVAPAFADTEGALGFHCPGGHFHPFSLNECPAGEDRILQANFGMSEAEGWVPCQCARRDDLNEAASRYCFRSSLLEVAQFDEEGCGRVENNSIGAFEFEGISYFNINTSTQSAGTLGGTVIGHTFNQTNQDFCESTLRGIFTPRSSADEADQCICRDNEAPNSLHGTCEACGEGMTKDAPTGGRSVCRPSCPDGEEYIDFGGERRCGPSNCPSSDSVYAANAQGSVRCVKTICGSGEIRDLQGNCTTSGQCIFGAQPSVTSANGETFNLVTPNHPSMSCQGENMARLTAPGEFDCGSCVPTSECDDPGYVFYGIEIGGETAVHCGPVAQCELAGGTRFVSGDTGNTSLTCADECMNSSHEKFGNRTDQIADDFCAAPMACPITQVPRDDNNGCVPRTAEHCEPNHVFQSAANGGTCVACTGGMESTGGMPCACPEGEDVFGGSECRLPNDNTECATVNEDEPIYDMNEPDNCRAIDRTDDCDDGEVFDATEGGCSMPNTGPECVDAKNENTYVGIDEGACVTGCETNPRTVLDDRSLECREPSLTDNCNDGLIHDALLVMCITPTDGPGCQNAKNSNFMGYDMDEGCIMTCPDARPILDSGNGECRVAEERDCDDGEVVDGPACAAPDTGEECRRAKNEDTYMGIDVEEGCVAMCPDARPILDVDSFSCRVANDRRECGDRLVFDPTEGGCSMPNTGLECLDANNEDTWRGIDNGVCVAICPDARPVLDDMTLQCRVIDRTGDCADRLVFDPAEGGCSTPNTGRECVDANNEDTWMGIDNGVCVDRCPDERPELDAAGLFCRSAILGECDNGQIVEEAACTDAETGLECARARHGGTPFIGIHNNACVTECPDRTGLNSSSECADCDSDEEAQNNQCVSICGNNELYNETMSACECVAGYENVDGSSSPPCVAACNLPEVRQSNGTCACGENQELNDTDDACECSEGFVDNTHTTPLDCVAACVNENEEINADGMCAPRPAASSGGGGGGGGGGAAALIAVPIVLIGGYWLLGGFDYIDPSYDFNYSGENDRLDWTGSAGFNLRHGGLRSYASAIQSNGDAVSYEAGISYEKDYLSLTYDAAESESEYLYDLGARMKATFGLWTIAPTAAAEFEYQLDEDEWNSESSAGLTAAWTAHRWKMEARSDFTGTAQHELDLELRF